MAAKPETAATVSVPYVPPLSEEELKRRNRALAALLDSFETDGDEGEQRETLAVLCGSLGAARVASSRKLFP